MTATLTDASPARAARTDRIPVAGLGGTGSLGQRVRRRGYIVTNSNCSTMGLALAIAPIEKRWGIEQLHVTTMQAVSGAGYNGVSSLAILDNVIPYISGEEEKIETEPRKILGKWDGNHFVDAPLRISAQTNRVPTIDGHLMTISLRMRDRDFDLAEIREALESFPGEPQRLGLPSA